MLIVILTICNYWLLGMAVLWAMMRLALRIVTMKVCGLIK